MCFEWSFWVKIATEKSLNFVNDIDFIIGFDVVDELDTFLKPLRVFIEKDEPLKIFTLWESITSDHLKCSLKSLVQEIEFLDFGKQVTQSHAKDWIVDGINFLRCLVEKLLVVRVIADKEFHLIFEEIMIEVLFE